MAESTPNQRSSVTESEYNIYGQPGYFTVNFTSPYMHQMSGFQSEEDAQAWIAETKLLVETYR
jgi:hypothetical protein